MSVLLKLKVCYVAGTLGQGGAERQLLYAIQAMRQSGATTRILCFEHGGFWEEPLKQAGAAVTWLGPHRSKFKRLVRIVKELKRDPPDILEARHFYTNAYASLGGLLLGSKAIGALRSN